tara:strand:- start:493 stop:936 length:444 start_codon:yes stop_codon:yes gene_type:complete
MCFSQLTPRDPQDLYESKLFPGGTYKLNQAPLVRGVQTSVHFWVVLGDRLIDPTDVLPGMEVFEKVYIPFSDTLQREITQSWTDVWHGDNRGCVLTDAVCNGYGANGSHGECFYNAKYYIHKHGGKLVCGAFGHRVSGRTVVLDYGY